MVNYGFLYVVNKYEVSGSVCYTTVQCSTCAGYLYLAAVQSWVQGFVISHFAVSACIAFTFIAVLI